MTDLQLCGTGWGPWPEQAARLSGWTAVWSDVSGAHMGSLPADPPVGATHVWAWREHLLARVRVDDGEAVVGFLHPVAACPLGHDECRNAQTSEPVVATSWAEYHVNVGLMRDKRWEVVEVVDGVSAVFVREAN